MAAQVAARLGLADIRPEGKGDLVTRQWRITVEQQIGQKGSCPGQSIPFGWPAIDHQSETAKEKDLHAQGITCWFSTYYGNDRMTG
jgi:hypothetical protein